MTDGPGQRVVAVEIERDGELVQVRAPVVVVGVRRGQFRRAAAALGNR